MGVWKQNLNRKLSKNSIECSEEFSSTTQKPTTLVVTTTKKVGAEFCDDKEDGLYSHDTSCSLYNECYQGQTWEGRPCPAGLHQWSSSVLAILFLLLLARSFSGNELSSSPLSEKTSERRVLSCSRNICSESKVFSSTLKPK